MRQSQLFSRTTKNISSEVESPSHALLVRAGFIDQLSAGIFTFLPLGLRVLKKIENIVREEMEAVGGQEILMPVLAPRENWEKTGRYGAFDVLFKLKGRNKEYVLNPTHEEVISPLAGKVILSYKDLPLSVFQIQTKFRNEKRAKSGLLRTREFQMKDLYSFHTDEKDLTRYYERVAKSYDKIFKKCGVVAIKTLASGGTFSKYSHEYQVITDSGEDLIHVCSKCSLAYNDELKMKKCAECKGSLKQKKAVEVGNIFELKDKYSLPFDLKFKDRDGKEKPVLMGCYGLGISRLLAAIVETSHDSRGIIWPENVSPYDIHLISIGKSKADKIYAKLVKERRAVLYDDRDVSAGEKFADADLIGISERWVVSEKNKGKIEVKKRGRAKTKLVSY